jgi:hypothetical protein
MLSRSLLAKATAVLVMGSFMVLRSTDAHAAAFKCDDANTFECVDTCFEDDAYCSTGSGCAQNCVEGYVHGCPTAIAIECDYAS